MNFCKYSNVTDIVIPNSVFLINNKIDSWFYWMRLLKTVNFNHPDITNMSNAYYSCHSLISNPVCGNKVTNMYQTYYYCNNLTGNPICGPNVTSMRSTYDCCYRLTGSPVCGDNITRMEYAYYNCRNLTGSPVCGDNVTNMSYTYFNCSNLIGNPVCGNNVISMYRTYYNCYNLSGNMYMYSNNVSNMRNCFYGKNNSNRYDIYAHQDTTTWNTLSINNTSSMIGSNITWTNYSNGSFYNTAYNIYVYDINAEASLITFYIGRTTSSQTSYQAEEGMTWEEWINSDYNTGGFYISGNSILSSAGAIESISLTDQIVNNQSYTLIKI